MNSLVLRHDETNQIWLKLDILARQMEIAGEKDEAEHVRESMAHVSHAQFTLLNLMQAEKARANDPV